MEFCSNRKIQKNTLKSIGYPNSVKSVLNFGIKSVLNDCNILILIVFYEKFLIKTRYLFISTLDCKIMQ